MLQSLLIRYGLSRCCTSMTSRCGRSMTFRPDRSELQAAAAKAAKLRYARDGWRGITRMRTFSDSVTAFRAAASSRMQRR
jgi:hypothetical protein